MDSDGVAGTENDVTVDQIVDLAGRLSSGDREKLIDKLLEQYQSDGSLRKITGFRGIWRARFDEDLDLEACLQKIRDESKRELEEIA